MTAIVFIMSEECFGIIEEKKDIVGALRKQLSSGRERSYRKREKLKTLKVLSKSDEEEEGIKDLTKREQLCSLKKS